MTTTSKSLGEAYPEEQARVRKALVIYHEIGPPGRFASIMLEDLLRRADKAVIEQDTVAMIRLYQEMREVEL